MNKEAPKQKDKSEQRRRPFDPLSLDAIELTAFVLGLFRKGVTTEELATNLARNYSLAGAYLRLFTDWRWIENQGEKWTLTQLGVESLPRFQSA